MGETEPNETSDLDLVILANYHGPQAEMEARAVESVLRAAGIEWHDIHAANVGYDAAGKLKALDLGLTKVKFKRKPVTLAGLRRALAGAHAALRRAPKL